MEMIARMQVSLPRAAQGIMLATMAGCGDFLFALMSAEQPEKMVLIVGVIGSTAGAVSTIIEIVTVTVTRRDLQRGHLRLT